MACGNWQLLNGANGCFGGGGALSVLVNECNCCDLPASYTFPSPVLFLSLYLCFLVLLLIMHIVYLFLLHFVFGQFIN